MIAIIVLSFSFSITFLSGRLNNTFVTAGKIINNMPLLGGTGNGTVEDDRGPHSGGEFTTGEGPGGHYTDPEAPVPVESDWYFISNGDGTWTADTYLGSATVVSVPYSHNGGVVNKVKNEDPWGWGTPVVPSVITEIYIPDSIKVIGKNAFHNATALKKFNIPDSVNSIDYGAFQGCTALENLSLPGSVKTIGSYAFAGCSGLKTAVLNEGTTTLGDRTFSQCSSLTSFIFVDSITTIGEGTLLQCDKLTTFSLPKTVTSMPSYTFYGCDSLTSIAIPGQITYIGGQAFGGCVALRKVFMPNDNLVSYNGFDGDTDLYATYYDKSIQRYKTIHYISIFMYDVTIDTEYKG